MIGIYGGTFDPIHNGHIHVIKELLRSSRVERILVVPAGQPQLRDHPIASSHDRLEMCRRAIAELGPLSDRVEVSAVEVERDRPSFAIDTVEALISQMPGKEMAWIIGSDAFRRIDQWHESARLQELISFIVIERPEPSSAQSDDLDDSDDFDAQDINALDISATEIRTRIKAGESVSGFLPATVHSYIESKGLYGSA